MLNNQVDARKQKIVFAGAARDCEKYLDKVLANLDGLSSIFQEVAFVFVENDSQDGTKKALASWGERKGNFYLINLDGLGKISPRGLRLEIARNVYAEFIKNDSRFSDYDYLCVIDMDDVSSMQIEQSSFGSALDFLEENPQVAGVFANQIGTYYDMWTLRDDQHCPVDIWQEVLEFSYTHKVTDQEAFNQTFAKRIFSLDPSSPPLEVDSAFGGLGIYKLEFVRKNKNPYLGSKIKVMSGTGEPLKVFRVQVCEHVHFNEGIRQQGGKLFVLPSLINANMVGTSFNCSYFRQIVF